MELRASLDLRYIGQWHELTVAVDLPLDVDAAEAAFHAEHDRLFGHASPGAPVEVLAVAPQRGRADARSRRSPAAQTTSEADARRGERPVWDPVERALEPTPVWDGRKLAVASTLAGPAIVELASTTIVVPRDFTLDVDAYGAFAVHTRRARRRVRAPARRRGVPVTAVERCGVLGVGALGAAIAARLATEGLEVAAYDLDPERVAALADVGVAAADSPARPRATAATSCSWSFPTRRRSRRRSAARPGSRRGCATAPRCCSSAR